MSGRFWIHPKFTRSVGVVGVAGRQAQIVAGNIRALITGDGELARYEPAPPSIIIPVGPDGGAGQRHGSDDLVPAEVVSQLKGRDMMVGRFAELLCVKTAEPRRSLARGPTCRPRSS